MAIRFMIDTDRLDKLTGHAELLATYADLVTNFDELERQFPHSQMILIHRGLGDPTGKASVFDIEPGALSAEQAVQLYDEYHARGVKYLTAYHDRAQAAEVAAAFGTRKPYNWDATLDGTAFIRGFDPLHSPAVIQALSAAELDYHADGSLVFEDSWNPRPANMVPAIIRRDINLCISQLAGTQSELHRMAALIGG